MAKSLIKVAFCASLMLGAIGQSHADPDIDFSTTSTASEDCQLAKMMLVVDHSSSMETGSIGGTTKWNIAKNAITTIVEEHDDNIQIGLMKFPAAGQCSPGQVDVEPSLNNIASIRSALTAPPPSAGNWTPMAQSLRALAREPSMMDRSDNRVAVLVTDGWQWCSPYDASTRSDPVTAVTELKNMGISTYIVGFGSSVDVVTLNEAAIAGGTAKASCDATSSGSNSCYYQADTSSQLIAALETIANNAGETVFDCRDDNCNGVVDEGLSRFCSTACGNGTKSCVNGEVVCSAREPGTREICDSAQVDEDCDGNRNEGCECQPGETRSCGEGERLCAHGQQTCDSSGEWGDCEGERYGEAEVCNDIDDDCDGWVDEYESDSNGRRLCSSGLVCAYDERGTKRCIAPPSVTPPDDETNPIRQENSEFVVSGGGCQATLGGSAGFVFVFCWLLAIVGTRRRLRKTKIS